LQASTGSGIATAVRARVLTKVVPLALAAAACGRPPSLVWEGAGTARQASIADLTAGLPAAGAGIRRGPWGDATDESLLLMDSAAAEEPHVHQRHDVTVMLLRGRGTLVVEGRRHDMRAGDVAHVARGKVHAFAPSGRATALAIFSPRLEAPDSVPALAIGNAGADAH
jgi:mannose-6-phosphate isomerase-like protein (cupin superfamily)